MRIIFSLVFFLFVISLKAENSIVIGSYELKPHLLQSTADKKIHGALYEFLENEIVKPLKIKSIWSFHPFSRAVTELEIGKIQMLGFLAKTPERELLLEYPKSPTFTTYAAIIVKKIPILIYLWEALKD